MNKDYLKALLHGSIEDRITQRTNYSDYSDYLKYKIEKSAIKKEKKKLYDKIYQDLNRENIKKHNREYYQKKKLNKTGN